MRRPIKIKARRGRPLVGKNLSLGGSSRGAILKEGVHLREEPSKKQEGGPSCLVKRLYQGGFIPFEALQAAYKFGDLYRRYLFALEGPRRAKVRVSCASSRLSPQNNCEDEALWEWKKTMETLRKFEPSAEKLLKKSLKEEGIFVTSDEILTLKIILQALADAYVSHYTYRT